MAEVEGKRRVAYADSKMLRRGNRIQIRHAVSMDPQASIISLHAREALIVLYYNDAHICATGCDVAYQSDVNGTPNMLSWLNIRSGAQYKQSPHTPAPTTSKAVFLKKNN
jgi:hypothetical protein